MLCSINNTKMNIKSMVINLFDNHLDIFQTTNVLYFNHQDIFQVIHMLKSNMQSTMS